MSGRPGRAMPGQGGAARPGRHPGRDPSTTSRRVRAGDGCGGWDAMCTSRVSPVNRSGLHARFICAARPLIGSDCTRMARTRPLIWRHRCPAPREPQPPAPRPGADTEQPTTRPMNSTSSTSSRTATSRRSLGRGRDRDEEPAAQGHDDGRVGEPAPARHRDRVPPGVQAGRPPGRHPGAADAPHRQGVLDPGRRDRRDRRGRRRDAGQGAGQPGPRAVLPLPAADRPGVPRRLPGQARELADRRDHRRRPVDRRR